MTLSEYKRQSQEIVEILMNFSGKEEEAEKFAKNLLEKYREFGEFNAKALECKDLAEFKNLANGNGMEFESDEEANETFLGLSKGKKEVEKAILSAEELYAVSGGSPTAGSKISESTFLKNMDLEMIERIAPGPAAVAAVGVGDRVDSSISQRIGFCCSLIGLCAGCIGLATILCGNSTGHNTSVVDGSAVTGITGLIGAMIGALASHYG